MANINDPRAMYESGEISSKSSRRNSIINKISGGAAALGETAAGAGKSLYDYTLSDNAPELVKSHKDAALLMLGGPIGSMFARSIAKETVGTLSNTLSNLKQNYKEHTQQAEYDNYEQPEPIEEVEEIYRSDDAVVNKKTRIKTKGKKQRVEVVERVRNKKIDPIMAARTSRVSNLTNSGGGNTSFNSFDKSNANAIISKRPGAESNTILGSETLTKRDLQFITYLSKSIIAKMEKTEQRTLAAKLTNNFAKNIGEAIIFAIPMIRMFNATRYSAQLPNAKKVGVFNAMNITMGMLYSATRSIAYETHRLLYSLIQVNKIGMGVDLKVKRPTDITTISEMAGSAFKSAMFGAIKSPFKLMGMLTGLSGGATSKNGMKQTQPTNSKFTRSLLTGLKGSALLGGGGLLGAGLMGMGPLASILPYLSNFLAPTIKGGAIKTAGMMGIGLGPLAGIVGGLGLARGGLGLSRMLTQGSMSQSWLGKKYQGSTLGKTHMFMSNKRKEWFGSKNEDGDDTSIIKNNAARDALYQQNHLELAQKTYKVNAWSLHESKKYYKKDIDLSETSMEYHILGYKRQKEYQEQDLTIQKKEHKEASWARKLLSVFTGTVSFIGKSLLALMGISAFSFATGSGGDFGTGLLSKVFDMKSLGNLDVTTGLLSGMGSALKSIGKKIPGLNTILSIGESLYNIKDGADITEAVGGALGTVGGGGLGMTVGASLGTAVAGPIGTVIGGVAGSILGSFLGAIGGVKASEYAKQLGGWMIKKFYGIGEFLKDGMLAVSISIEKIWTNGWEFIEKGIYGIVNALANTISTTATAIDNAIPDLYKKYTPMGIATSKALKLIGEGSNFQVGLDADANYKKIHEEMDKRHAQERKERKSQKDITYASFAFIDEMIKNTKVSYDKETGTIGLRDKTEAEIKAKDSSNDNLSLFGYVTSFFTSPSVAQASPEAQASANAVNSMGVPGSNYKPTGNKYTDSAVNGLSWIYKKTGFTLTDPSYLNVPNNSQSKTSTSAGSTATTSTSTIKPSSGSVKIPDHFKDLVYKYASQNGLDPNLVAAVIKAESNWDPMAGSSAGARGLMQMMPGTASDLGVKNITDPEDNIRGGTKYLADMINKYGSIPLGLAAYNSGPGNVDKYGGIPPFEETQSYVKKIMGWYNGTSPVNNSTAKPSSSSSKGFDMMTDAGVNQSSGVPSWSNMSSEWWTAAKQRANEAAGYVNKWMDEGGVERTAGNIANTASSVANYSYGKFQDLTNGPLNPEGMKNYLKANYEKIPELKEYIENSTGISTDEIIDNYMNREKLSSAYTANNLSDAFGNMTAKTTSAMSELGSGMKSMGNQMVNVITSMSSSNNSSQANSSNNGNAGSDEILDNWPTDVRSLVYGYYD